MPGQPGLLREVYDDLRHEARLRRLQLLAGLAYAVLAAGGLYLFSAVGEDSGDFADVQGRTTLAAVGTGLLAVSSVLCGLTVVLVRADRRRPSSGREPGVLPDGRLLAATTALAVALTALGAWALTRWS